MNRFSSYRHREMVRILIAAARSVFVFAFFLFRVLFPVFSFLVLYAAAAGDLIGLGQMLAGVCVVWIIGALCWTRLV